MSPKVPSPDREEMARNVMEKTGKSREQVDAFLALVAHALFDEPHLTKEEYSEKLDLFLGRKSEG